MITPVARLTEIQLGAAQGGAAIQYIRPVRLDIDGPGGAQVSVPITDHAFALRMLAVAVVVLAYIVGRMRT